MGFNLEADFAPLEEFVDYCVEKGLKPGIYWAPFVDFGKFDRRVEGSSFDYVDIWTNVNGNYHDLDDCRALDPTHPGTKARIDLVIDKFKQAGFEMIKIDFIGHASIEATSFHDPTIKTGMQAFRAGMEYLIDRIGDDMLVYTAISPNIATTRYTHVRRIACDAFTNINDTEYTLNSNTYGWWQSEIYDYIDADHIVFGNATLGENRARLLSAIVNGTLITGDDFSSDGPWNQRAQDLLQNQNILNLAKRGNAFRPVEGSSNTASELFQAEIDNKIYIVIFNYGEAKTFNIDLNRLNLNANGYCLTDVFTGNRFPIDGSLFTIDVGEKDAMIFEFDPGAASCVFSLPNNFRVFSKDATCFEKNDGEINIEFENTSFAYQLNRDGENTVAIPVGESSYNLENLAAGIYQFCFSIAGIPDYEQCFEININQPEEVIAFPEFNDENGILLMNFSGAEKFYVTFNGKEELYEVGSYEFQLKNGLNEITVKGEFACQGAFSKKYFFKDKIKIHPNPTDGLINLTKQGKSSEKFTISIFNTQGILLKTFTETLEFSNVIQVDIRDLREGLYILQVDNKHIKESFKVIKR